MEAWDAMQAHLDEGIGLQTFWILDCDFETIGGRAEDGVVFKGDGFQYIRQIPSVVQTGHKHAGFVGLGLGRQRHCPPGINTFKNNTAFYVKHLLYVKHIWLVRTEKTFWSS